MCYSSLGNNDFHVWQPGYPNDRNGHAGGRMGWVCATGELLPPKTIDCAETNFYRLLKAKHYATIQAIQPPDDYWYVLA